MAPFWDRTDEFRQLVESTDSQYIGDVGNTLSGSHLSADNGLRHIPINASNRTEMGFEEETYFSKAAADIGHELQSTNRRITDLEKIVKQCGIFEDRSAEIQTITYHVRQSIVGLSSQLDSLERDFGSTRQEVDNPHIAAHYRSVTLSLRTRLGETTIELKRILEIRAQGMKVQQDRRGLYSHSTSSKQPSRLFISEEMVPLGAPDLESEDPFSHQRQTQLFASRRPEPMYQTVRAEAVESVQKMIGELAQIFNKVATLVSTQEELAIRIEDDMSSALHNIHQGEAHLAKYLRSISSNRSLIFKVFGVLIFFVIFFIVFLS